MHGLTEGRQPPRLEISVRIRLLMRGQEMLSRHIQMIGRTSKIIQSRNGNWRSCFEGMVE